MAGFPQPGPQGPQGAQGAAGAQGAQGTQGHQGTPGAQGAQGSQGHQGNQGFQGTPGPQGNQGTQGFQGNQGVQGAQGSSGGGGNFKIRSIDLDSLQATLDADSGWVEVAVAAGDASGAFDITIPASVGDVLQICPNLATYFPAQLGPSYDQVTTFYDFESVNAGTYVSSGTDTPATLGVCGWLMQLTKGPQGNSSPITGPFFYTVVADDISGGNVVLRFYANNASPSDNTYVGQENPDQGITVVNMGQPA